MTSPIGLFMWVFGVESSLKSVKGLMRMLKYRTGSVPVHVALRLEGIYIIYILSALPFAIISSPRKVPFFEEPISASV